MKTKVKLGLNNMNALQLLGFSNNIVVKMTGNQFFTDPQPTLEKITNLTIILQNDYNSAQGGGPEQTAAMNQSMEHLKTQLSALGNYVENIANEPVNAEVGGEKIVLSAGMNVRQFTPAQKQTFKVERGDLPGVVSLVAASVKRGSHEWQYKNQSAEAWIDAEPTTQARTTIKGLEPGKNYDFRHRAVTPEGVAAWDDPEDIIVV